MQCPNCGQQRVASLKRCRNCGHAFTGAPVEAELLQATAPSQPAPPTPVAQSARTVQVVADTTSEPPIKPTTSVPVRPTATRYGIRPGYPHEASLAARRELYQAQNKSIARWYLFWSGVLAIVFWGLFQGPGLAWWVGYAVAPLGFVVAWTAVSQFAGNSASATDYYRFPHSTENGEHRCIHCGHASVWRRGRYRSNATIVHCGNCGTYLFYE